MIIQYGSTPLTVANPEFGYKVRVQTAMRIAQRADGSYSIYDPSYIYDTYFCTCTAFLHVLDMADLMDVFLNIAKGRGMQVTLTPGTGFYPFGPYRGDVGPFSVKIMDIKQKTTVGHPEDYIPTELTFAYTGGAFPSYAPASQVAEGDLTIGLISGLRWPNSQPSLTADYGIDAQVTHGNYAYIIDRTISKDTYQTEMGLVLNQTNMAALQNYLLATGRGGTISITPPANTYLFGVENLSTDTYSVNWINGSLEMTNETFNRWTTKLTFNTI